MNWQIIAKAISDATGSPFKVENTHTIGGGCINSAYRLQGTGEEYFVKINRSELLPMFKAEFAGLQEMAFSHSVKVPAPVVCGVSQHQAYIVIEYIALKSASPVSFKLLGTQLAQMHSQQQAYFGWPIDNTIGSTRQPNARKDDWLDFWRERRLGFQLQLAETNGYGARLQHLGDRLCADFDGLFSTYSPLPALLHGDLWGGNAAADEQAQPVIFDPACYYGDHEADLAMTELFGGFGSDFYAAYNDVFPLDPGYAVRKHFYNLYHILNHLNLFGGSYAGQAVSTMEKILAEL